MRHTLALLLALLTVTSTAAAQDREYIRLLERLLVGASGAINTEITDLRRQLARCDGPPNQRLPSDNCAARTLIQAQLNYLLRMGMEFGDPDTAGTRASTPVVPPTSPDLVNYKNLRAAAFEKVRSEPPFNIVHVISEDRAKVAIIDHCAVMKDPQARGLTAMMTTEELTAFTIGGGQTRVNADVNACIPEYDAKEIAANRKAALEYCFQSYNYVADSRAIPRFNMCMNTHDMLQAMCKQQLELQVNYQTRSLPGVPRALPVTCPGVQPNPNEIKAILSAPAARTMAELPPKFLAVPSPPPPDPRYPVPMPPVPIPTGTVLETTLNGQIDAASVDTGLGQGIDVSARLDRPLVVGGQTVLAPPTLVFLRARIIGPGAGPDSVLIGVTTLQAQKNGNEGGFALKSNELVFTVAKGRPAPAGLRLDIPTDTKLRFTIGSSASSAAPSAGASPATPSTTPGSLDPRRQAERQAACAQQAYKDHPQGGVVLMQALSACAQTK